MVENELSGIGFQNMMLTHLSDDDKYSYVRDSGGHDIISVIFAAIGIPGSLLVLYIFFKTYKYLNIAVKNYSVSGGDRYLLNLGITLKAAYIALLSTSFGNDIIHYNTFWIYVALAVVLYRLSVQHKSTEKLKYFQANLITDKLMSPKVYSAYDR